MSVRNMVRIASQDLGPDASRDEFQKYLRERFRKQVDVRHMPVYRAALRGEAQLPVARAMPARIVQEETAAGSGKAKERKYKRRHSVATRAPSDGFSTTPHAPMASSSASWVGVRPETLESELPIAMSRPVAIPAAIPPNPSPTSSVV
jgi:hypothetical protein